MDNLSDDGSTNETTVTDDGGFGDHVNQNDDTATTEDGDQTPDYLAAYNGENGEFDADKAKSALFDLHKIDAERREQFGDVPDGDYDLALGDDLVDKDGKPLAIDPENQFLKDALGEFKTLGIGQKAVTGFLQKYAQSAIADAQAMVEGLQAETKAKTQAEFESLGEKRNERYDSVIKHLSEAAEGEKPILTEEQTKALVGGLKTRAAFEALEKVLNLNALDGEGRQPNAGGTDVNDKSREAVANRMYSTQA